MFGFLKNKLPPHVSTEAADELIDSLESLRIEGSNGWDAVETLESSHDYYEWADLKLIAGFAGSLSTFAMFIIGKSRSIYILFGT